MQIKKRKRGSKESRKNNLSKSDRIIYTKKPSTNLETKSANDLICIFREERFGFNESYAEISKQSSVLANVIVHAM